MKVEIKSVDLERLCDEISKHVGEVLIFELERSIKRVDAIATGYLAKSFRWKKIGKMKYVVESEAPYSSVVEFGCSPHIPPFEPILKWVNIKKKEYGEEAEKSAWRIIRKIEKYGYEGRYYARMALSELIRKFRGVER